MAHASCKRSLTRKGADSREVIAASKYLPSSAKEKGTSVGTMLSGFRLSKIRRLRPSESSASPQESSESSCLEHVEQSAAAARYRYRPRPGSRTYRRGSSEEGWATQGPNRPLGRRAPARNAAPAETPRSPAPWNAPHAPACRNKTSNYLTRTYLHSFDVSFADG